VIPQDGMGHGCSLYWEMKAKQIAKKKHEYCPCWDLNNPVIRSSEEGKLNMRVHCFDPSADCQQDFHKTNKALTKKFKEMYGISMF